MEALYKRRGNTFTTSEGRILRSSQVDIKRKTSRHLIYSNGRNLETEAETSLHVKKAAERRQKSEGLPSGSAAKAAAVSRREKLNEFLEKKRIIEDAKRKKAK